ncbi:uncharacterized protein LOC112038379 [Quercus suber]|uniref:uncharacterized protein LOC112038379 n=1 Tax=Quercus suber TaxID=58331 RepID=UPI0032DEE007
MAYTIEPALIDSDLKETNHDWFKAYSHSTARWIPPSAPTLKVNYDGAVFRETNEAGLGAVIRNSAGRVVASSVERITLPQTVAEVEAAAARRAILLTKELNLSSITLEGDSEIITRALQDAEQSLATFGNLIGNKISRRPFS